jgi:hypothetical protein
MIKLNVFTVPEGTCAAELGKVSRGFSFPYHIRIGSEVHRTFSSNCYPVLFHHEADHSLSSVATMKT